MPGQIITPKPAEVEYYQPGTSPAAGSIVARLRANKYNVNAFRTNTVLSKEEWIAFDAAILREAQQRLQMVDSIVSAGMFKDLPNAMGTTVLQYEALSSMEEAELTMDGKTKTQKDRPEWDLRALPIPIIHKDFEINLRNNDSQSNLDTIYAELATRQVVEKVETTVISGASGMTFGGGTLYGILDAPNRNTVTITGDWATLTGLQILTDVLSMISDAEDANMYGPYELFITTAYDNVLDKDYSANYHGSIRTRLSEINKVTKITVIDKMPADTVVLMQMTRDVMDMVIGQQPTLLEWSTDGGFTVNFKVLTIMVPRVKYDFALQSGITVLS